MSLFDKQIVIIGSAQSTEEMNEVAYKVGKLLAEKKYIVVCGGREGVMEYACKGAKEADGMTIGILPDNNADAGNRYLDIVIPTGIGFSRNHIVQNSGAAIIMIGGSYGTLNELAFSQTYNKKVVSLISKWEDISPDIIKAYSPEDAVGKAIQAASCK